VLVLGAGKKRGGETQQGGAPDEGVCLSFLHLVPLESLSGALLEPLAASEQWLDEKKYRLLLYPISETLSPAVC
jgi:hypothetical protein